MPYADVEALLIPWLTSTLSVRALTDTPSDLSAQIPLMQVTRTGGGDDQPTLDAAEIDIDCFAADLAGVNSLVKSLRQAMCRTLPGLTLTAADSSQAVFTRVQNTGNHRVPYPDTAVRRVVSTYLIHLKARP